jgi:hypothetical protein
MAERKRLKPEEASFFGFSVKPKEGIRHPRYSLTKEQLQQLQELRKPLLTVTGKSTLTDAEGNVIMEWTKENLKEQDRLKAVQYAIEALKEDIEPTKPIERPKKQGNPNLINQYTLTDYHLGMMAWHEESGSDWDMKIAEDTLVNFFEIAISHSPECDEAIFSELGDFLHWDGLDAVTPGNGHLLDADTRFTKLVRVAIRVIRRVITMLLEKYQKVHLIIAEGNHNLASSVWMREMLSSFYENEPRLVIDTRPDPYYCITFGKNCLFYHHGHKRGLNNIDSVFVSKFKKEFGESDFVYGHIGHLHNLQVKETNLMVLEQHRTLAAKDAYASRGGWGSDRDAKVITYHKDYGEVSRQTINIKMLE